jgi:hypothetical protein
LLPIRERVSGPERSETLAERVTLTHWTGQAGDAASARDQLAALLPTFERALGSEHPHTLTERTRIAHWTGQAGDAASARDQYAALLPIWERILGSDHPDTMDTRNQLDYWAERLPSDSPRSQQRSNTGRIADSSDAYSPPVVTECYLHRLEWRLRL